MAGNKNIEHHQRHFPTKNIAENNTNMQVMNIVHCNCNHYICFQEVIGIVMITVIATSLMHTYVCMCLPLCV